jgi:tRNA A-37 threonylcarbamoyl transferase component Bud32
MSVSPDRDSELEAALQEYLTRIEEGESPDQEELKTRHPGVAGELQEFFDNLRLVETELDSATRLPESPLNRLASRSSFRVDGNREGGSFPVLPGFRILEEIGGGTQGIVYRAEQLNTRRIVALKVIRHGPWASEKERRRFENEVELASRLVHPHIVQVYECGNYGGQSYFAMQYVEGERLDHYIWENRLGLRDTIHLFLQVCEAVRYAHQRGVMHRDLKPGNVLVDRNGQAHILDFGLAKPVDEQGSSVTAAATQIGEFAGTWHYASPEQVRRDPARIDTRTDVYALGIILYELLTRNLPYPIREEHRDDVARFILDYPPTPPRNHRRDIPEDLDTVLLKAIEKDVGRRYQSAGELADDLRRFLEGTAVEARRASRWYIFRKTLRRYRLPVALSLVAFAAVSVFAAVTWRLYTETLNAKATLEVRARAVRHTQRTAQRHLAELQHLNNIVRFAASTGAPLNLHGRFDTPAAHESEPHWRPLAADAPANILADTTGDDPLRRQTARDWLTERAGRIDEIAVQLADHRIAAQLAESGDSSFTFEDRWDPGFSIQNLCAILCAAAVLASESDDIAVASKRLNAARLAALDAADGESLHHKIVSAAARQLIHETVFHLLTARGRLSRDPAFLDWVTREPPMPSLRFALGHERRRSSQYVEYAAFATRDIPEGFLDVDLIVQLRNSQLPPDLLTAARAAASATTPEKVLAGLDAYITAMASLEGLPVDRVRERARTLMAEFQSDPSYPVVRVLVPGPFNMALNYTRIESCRRALVLTAFLFRHHAETGRWPEDLATAIPVSHRDFLRDPYSDRSFHYRRTTDLPLLYAVNDDLTDDGGLHGDWDQPGTDVVFFPPPRKPSPRDAPANP